jgi:hypothetical protein
MSGKPIENSSNVRCVRKSVESRPCRSGQKASASSGRLFESIIPFRSALIVQLHFMP